MAVVDAVVDVESDVEVAVEEDEVDVVDDSVEEVVVSRFSI